MLATMPEAAQDAEMMGAIGQLSDVGYVSSLMFYMILFFIGGYLFYSTQSTRHSARQSTTCRTPPQLSTIATMPVIIGIVTSMSAVQNPGSTMAFWVSLIPSHRQWP